MDSIFTPLRRRSDIFISYARADKPRVATILKRLHEAGLKVWVDESALEHGEILDDGIKNGLQRSGALAVVMTQASCNSNWVSYEVEHALLYKKTVFVIRVNGAQMPPKYDILKNIVWCDITDDVSASAHELDRLIRRLKQLRQISTAKIFLAATAAVLLAILSLSAASARIADPPMSDLYVYSEVVPLTVYLDGTPKVNLSVDGPGNTIRIGQGTHTFEARTNDGRSLHESLTLGPSDCQKLWLITADMIPPVE